MLEIQFRVRAQALPTQIIKIAGSLPQLGNWNPQKGLQLERVHHSEWESTQPIEVPQGTKFYFKLVKLGSTIEWEKLPNNSNRTFKPKFRSKLIITWSLAEGKIINESRRSYKVKDLPAAIINNGKINKKSSIFDPYKSAKINSDEENKDDDNFGFLQKKIVSKPSLSEHDIQEIYYDTSQTELLVSEPKILKVYLISRYLSFKEQFHLKIRDIINNIEYASFKWLYFRTKENDIEKDRKISYYCIQKDLADLENQKLTLSGLSSINTFFIFLDIEMINKIDIADSICSLYLQGKDYLQALSKIDQLKMFKHIAFDDPQANQLFFGFLSQKNIHSQNSESDRQEQISKHVDYLSIESLIQQLRIDHFGESMKVNTVYTISINEALEQILQPRSFLIIDSQIYNKNNIFLKSLIANNIPSRMVAIIADQQIPNYYKDIDNQNVVLIYKNWSKFIMKGETHQPMQKHNQVIQIVKMKAKLTQQAYGGSYQLNQQFFVYKNQQQDLLQKFEKEVRLIVKDFNYFKTTIKNNKVKLSWSLSPQIRLIRTLCRLKYLSKGKINNFYIISAIKDFEFLKDQIKILVSSKNQFLEYGLRTKVKYYKYGSIIPGNYTIIINDQKKNVIDEKILFKHNEK